VLLRPALAHDAEVAQQPQQHRVRARQDEVDGVVVDLLHLLHAGDIDLHRALLLVDAAEGEHHVVGG
jgi:hypothetical protein